MTDLEIEALKLSALGYKTKEIAAEMNRSERAIEWYFHTARNKLNAKTQIQAVCIALKKGYFKENLSKQEKEALQWLSDGKRIKQMTEFMHKSDRSIHNYVHNAKKKLGCRTTTEAVCNASILNYLS